MKTDYKCAKCGEPYILSLLADYKSRGQAAIELLQDITFYYAPGEELPRQIFQSARKIIAQWNKIK